MPAELYLIFELYCDKPRLTSVPALASVPLGRALLRPYSEVEPVAAGTVALYQELVEVAPGIVCDVEEDARHADGLLDAGTADIHGAARQVVGTFAAAYEGVHLRRAVARSTPRAICARRVSLFYLSYSIIFICKHTLRDCEIARLRDFSVF